MVTQQMNVIQKQIQHAASNGLGCTPSSIGPVDLSDLPMILPLDGNPLNKGEQMATLANFSQNQLISMFMMEKERREVAEKKLAQCRGWLHTIIGNPAGAGEFARTGIFGAGNSQQASPQQGPMSMKRRRMSDGSSSIDGAPYNPLAMPPPGPQPGIVAVPGGPPSKSGSSSSHSSSSSPVSGPCSHNHGHGPHVHGGPGCGGAPAGGPGVAGEVKPCPHTNSGLHLGSFSSYVPDSYKKFFLCPYNACKRALTGTCMWSHDPLASKFDTNYTLLANLEFAQQNGLAVPPQVIASSKVEDPQVKAAAAAHQQRQAAAHQAAAAAHHQAAAAAQAAMGRGAPPFFPPGPYGPLGGHHLPPPHHPHHPANLAAAARNNPYLPPGMGGPPGAKAGGYSPNALPGAPGPNPAVGGGQPASVKPDPLGGRSFSSFVPNECRKYFACPYNQCKRDASQCMWSHDPRTSKFDTTKSVVENLDIVGANGIEVPDDVRNRAEEQAKSKELAADIQGSFSSYVPQGYREFFACPYSSCKWGGQCQWSHETAARKFDIKHTLRENLELALGSGMNVTEEVLRKAEEETPKAQ